MQRKFDKKFFISVIFTIELLARDSPTYGENTCHWQTLILTNSPKISDVTKK